MSSAMRPYLTAGVALAGAGIIAVTPVAPVTPPSAPALPVVDLDVQLTAGDSILNVPVNLINDILNIPYVLFSKPYSVEGLIPQFATDDQTVMDDVDYPAYDGPDDGIFHGSLNFLGAALDYTGSWWLSSPTNVWGWDTANPWNFEALINLLPFPALAQPLAVNLNNVAAAEFPQTPGCEFTCLNLAGELANYNQVTAQQLENGYTFPQPYDNVVGVGANALGQGGEYYPEIWSGTTVTVDNSAPWNDFMQHLMADPSENPIQLPDLGDIFNGIQSFLAGFWKDFEIFTLFLNPDSVIYAIARSALGWDQPITGALSAEVPDSDTLAGSLSEQLGDPTAGMDSSTILSDATADVGASLGV